MRISNEKKFGLLKRLFWIWGVSAIWILTACAASAGDAANTPASGTEKNDAKKSLRIKSMTVTAHKQPQVLQDVPDSLTVLDNLEIEDAMITDMDTLAAHVPGLEFINFGSRRHAPYFMRGIKSVHSGEPATGYYVDGVNYSKSYMFGFPLFDIERIEILRGPQGTLYGNNTMGGVINIHTRKPGNETEGTIGVTYGNYNLMEIKGGLKAPLVKDTLFVGLAGLGSKRDGYMENTVHTDGEEGRHWEGGSGRLKLRYLPSDALEMVLTVDGQSYDGGAFPFRKTARNAFVKKGMFPKDSPYHYSNDFEGTTNERFWGSALSMDYKTAFGTFSSVSGYRDYNTEEFIDTDFSSLDMMRMRYEQNEQSFTQEFRFSSTASTLPLKWLCGAYYFMNDRENNQTQFYRSAMAGNPGNPFSPGTGNRRINSVSKNDGYALFGQATYSLLKNLDLCLGLRWGREDAKIDRTRFDTPDNGATQSMAFPHASNDYASVTPKASLSWRVTPEHMLYATFAGGQRSGGFNMTAPKGKLAYDEETGWLYEIGAKLVFFQRRLRMNLAGFYMDLHDEQITHFDVATNVPYVVNAGESHRLGLEAEIKYALATGLDLNAGICLLQAEYDSYADPARGIDYAGNTVYGVPEYTFNLGAQYRRRISGQWGFFGRMDIFGTGPRYFDDANQVEGDAFELVNLRLGVEGKWVEIYAWSKNLFDREYVVFENTEKGIAEDGEPRTIGISASIRF